MTQKILLTGGPGTGKSSIILALESQGEYTIREAAEDVIKLRQSQGHPEPWMDSSFQKGILELQIQRESRIPKEAERVFMDRGLADGLAYSEPGTEIYKQILEAVTATKYDRVYLVENLGFTEKTDVRKENQEEAIQLGNKLREVYKELGYNPITIPVAPVDERVIKVLENL